MTDEHPSIEPRPDGPYMVKNLKNLANRHGPVETKPAMALCRCGRSSNKPFCDGTHKSIGFSSAKSDERQPDRLDRYEGDGVTVRDNRGTCAHAGYCTDGLPAVFRLRQEPFVDPNGASPDEIAAVVAKCPSGALSVAAAAADASGEPSVFVAPNGPNVVQGGPELVGVEQNEGASPEHFTLCRCGQSKNKPFCDGTHWSVEFDEDAK